MYNKNYIVFQQFYMDFVRKSFIQRLSQEKLKFV